MGKPKNTKLLQFRVPEALHRKIRMHVARHDSLTLQAFAEQAITEKLAGPVRQETEAAS